MSAWTSNPTKRSVYSKQTRKKRLSVVQSAKTKKSGGEIWMLSTKTNLHSFKINCKILRQKFTRQNDKRIKASRKSAKSKQKFKVCTTECPLRESDEINRILMFHLPKVTTDSFKTLKSIKSAIPRSQN